MVRQLASLGRVGIIPQTIVESVGYIMGAGCFAINAAWSNQVVALSWQGPRESMECLPAPETKKVSNASWLGPLDVIASTAEAGESGSTVAEADFGQWSSERSRAQPSALAAAPPFNRSFGPWGGLASAGSLSSSLGHRGVHRRSARRTHIWPLGHWHICNF